MCDPLSAPMGSRVRRALLLIAAPLVLAGGLVSAEEPRYWVVVNPDNPIDELSRSEVSKLFLKKSTKWSNGTPVVPVDLPEKAQARAAFSMDVHGRSASAIKKYWQQKVFSGEAAPPPEAASEEDVLAQVRADPHAVGYVSDEAVLKGVKILDVVDPPSAVKPTPVKATAAPSH
jgi:ABC-type phosphate transport system substrate-binding protein